MKRILVIGLPGAGKTTFARQIALEFGVPLIEADRLFWTAELTEAPEFREKVRRGIEKNAWVFEGHFTKVRDLVLPRAEAIVWLKPVLPVVLFRFLRRSINGPRRGGTLRFLLAHYRCASRQFRAAIRGAEASAVPVFVVKDLPTFLAAWKARGER